MAVKDATEIAKSQGKMPLDLDKLIEELNEHQIDWRNALRDFMMNPAKEDFNWTRPNRRFIYQNLYLPSLYSLSIGNIILVTDSSGSVSKKEYEAFGGEFNGIIEDALPVNLAFVVSCILFLKSTKP